MDRNWSYYNPVDIRFGIGVRRCIPKILESKKCLIVSSARGRAQIQSDPYFSDVSRSKNISWMDTVSPNPGVKELEECMVAFDGTQFDAVVAFGGGSAMDSAKALSIGMSQELRQFSLSELVATPKIFEYAKGVPLFAIPTTAGTGSEVTPFATIWDHSKKKKLSLAGRSVFPCMAIVDPELMTGLPIEPTISTGLDAINQALESIWNHNAIPITLEYASRALALGIEALPNVLSGNMSLDKRANMAECSLLAGLSISHTRTALCHSISYPITSHFGVPHGLACAFTMPSVLRLNLRSGDSRFQDLENKLGKGSLIKIVDHLHELLGVQEKVLEYIPNRQALLNLVDKMYTPDRADNNLVSVNLEDIQSILLESSGL